ncbi:MAG: hypothetical protein AB4368_14210 [Xenococcaceae cyanobacterium]
MVEHQSGDAESSISKGDNNGATSKQLGVAKQLLNQISGSLRRADKSITAVQWVIDELPLAVANLGNRVKELGGKEQQSVVPTREQDRQPQLESEPTKKVQSFQQEDWDLER